MNVQAWDGARQCPHMPDVGTRHGLQVEQRAVETAEQIVLVDALSESDLAQIGVTLFASPWLREIPFTPQRARAALLRPVDA